MTHVIPYRDKGVANLLSLFIYILLKLDISINEPKYNLNNKRLNKIVKPDRKNTCTCKGYAYL